MYCNPKQTEDLRCEGAACAAVDIAWDSTISAYRAKNHGGRSVSILLTGTSGVVRVRLSPGESQVLAIIDFEHPYRAEFEDH